MQQIHGKLSREFPEHTLEEFKTDNFLTYPAINFATRYFTSLRDDPYTTSVPFPSSVDPKGILSSMQTDIYIHAADNQVLYYILQNKTPPQYVLLPIIFKIFKLNITGEALNLQNHLISVLVMWLNFNQLLLQCQ